MPTAVICMQGVRTKTAKEGERWKRVMDFTKVLERIGWCTSDCEAGNLIDWCPKCAQTSRDVAWMANYRENKPWTHKRPFDNGAFKGAWTTEFTEEELPDRML